MVLWVQSTSCPDRLMSSGNTYEFPGYLSNANISFSQVSGLSIAGSVEALSVTYLAHIQALAVSS